MSGLRNRARCRNWRASHRLLEYPSETRRFQNEDQQSIRRDAQGSEATWPLTKASAFTARAAGPFPQALVSPHCCWKDRKSVVQGKSGSEGVALGGRGNIKKKKQLVQRGQRELVQNVVKTDEH